MTNWMPVGDGFIEADVIRWTEPVFKNRRYGKPDKVGVQRVTAEVLREADREGWVYLLVRMSEAISARPGWNLSDVLPAAWHKETRRRLRTILRGDVERLAWSDESARALVAGQVLGNPNPAPTVAPDTGEDSYLRSAFNPVSRLSKPRSRKPGWEAPGLHP